MLDKRISDLHRNSIVVDLHVDPILQHLLFDYDLTREHDLEWMPAKNRLLFRALRTLAKFKKLHHPFFNHVDLPRMRKGGYSFGAFGIHYWPVQSEKGWHSVLRQLDFFSSLTSTGHQIELAKTPAEVRASFRNGRLCGFCGVEGVHCLGESGQVTMNQRLGRIELLFNNYGVRYLTLSHFSRNDAATPCMGLGSNTSEGLTEFGKDVVRKMNEVGMLVDVAHVNTQGALDACSVSSKPVIVTHSGIKELHDHPRCISAEVLHAVKETGGLVGVMFATNFLSGAKSNPTSQIILDHIDYIVREAGDEHAAIGSDFDGWIPNIPQDMTDAADLPLLTDAMLRLGYSNHRIRNILGMNFLRLWEKVLS